MQEKYGPWIKSKQIKLYLVEAGVGLRQVVVLVVQPRDLEGHLAHAADGYTITSGREKQKLFL